MISEFIQHLNEVASPGVLILVLVEDGLGGTEQQFMLHLLWVLILVLVEDGLGAVRWF